VTRVGSLLAGVLLTVLAAVSLAGCSSGNAVNTGPFGNGGGTGSVCSPVPPGGVLSFGFEEFQNSGSTATISKVNLADPHNLIMRAAYAVPIVGHDLYGVVHGWPPESKIPNGVQWANRQNADGATILHSRGSDLTNLVLVLQPTQKAGTAKGVNVYYKAAGQQYHLQTAFAIRVVTGKSC
jgi:hypothetical protein